MSLADRFSNEWWDLQDSYRDREREHQLWKEEKEVLHEMIYQEYKSGKSPDIIAEDYNVHRTTVYRIAERRKDE